MKNELQRQDIFPILVPHPPYEAPQLTVLGQWSAVTLVQSVPIGSGGFGSVFDWNDTDKNHRF